MGNTFSTGDTTAATPITPLAANLSLSGSNKKSLCTKLRHLITPRTKHSLLPFKVTSSAKQT